MTPATPLLLYHPDAYGEAGGRIMGRHAAGRGLLRALAERRTPLAGMGVGDAREADFSAAVAAFAPETPTTWVPAGAWERVGACDALLVPGPGLADHAAKRLRHGEAAFSLVGVTHTLSSDRALKAVADNVAGPVMPWDAIVCTSRVARSVVELVLAGEEERLAARFGATRFVRPLLPVVPLGVHCTDFAFSGQRRAEARARLGLAEDEVLAISTGRLSFHAKAHPLPMYAGLQAAAERTGRRIVLVQSSWFANGFIEEAFKDGARRFCPSVRCLWSDGTDALSREDVWAAGDLFIALSDNVQETFGLTPVEAMAAGLPVVATDWNGYRDTIRDGIDGFLVPTTMPGPPHGQGLAAGYEAETLNYDRYCGATALAVSLDLQALFDRLTALVANGDLRRRIGAQGRRRALAAFDWPVVLGQLQQVWDTCRAIRLAAQPEGSRPGEPLAQGRDPFQLFASYPTTVSGGATQVRQGPLWPRCDEIAAHASFSHAAGLPLLPESIHAVRAALAGPAIRVSLAAIAADAGLPLSPVVLAGNLLAKMGVVVLEGARPVPRAP